MARAFVLAAGLGACGGVSYVDAPTTPAPTTTSVVIPEPMVDVELAAPDASAPAPSASPPTPLSAATTAAKCDARCWSRQTATASGATRFSVLCTQNRRRAALFVPPSGPPMPSRSPLFGIP